LKKIKTDYLIVGSGLYGCVLAERIATTLKKKVIILEKRDHIGGNCYSEFDKKTGIEFHKYGTHIFHTSIKHVWEYIKNFTSLNNYRHQVLSRYKNKIYQMPINLETINTFFNKNFDPMMARNFILNQTRKYLKVEKNNFDIKARSQIGDKLYDAFIKNYTLKQWGKHPKDLPSFIFNRLPLRFDYREDYYKNSLVEGIPLDGYTKIFERLVDNRNIEIVFNTNYEFENDHNVKYLTIYTGPLDKLLKNKFGKLEWRSLKFKKELINQEDFQGTSVINHPELKYKFTRIHEPKHLHPERIYGNKTLIIKEFSNSNNDEPFYPINNNKNKVIYNKYKNYLKSKDKKFIFGGRLGDYAYYDMDMTISAALKKFQHIKKNFS
jgi:UDP-galactopyranose mutase